MKGSPFYKSQKIPNTIGKWPLIVKIGGDKDVFYGGRHALKTYVCARIKSSSNAMGRLAGAENVIQTI